jgi:hypothetical protein
MLATFSFAIGNCVKKTERTVSYYDLKMVATSVGHPQPTPLTAKNACVLIGNLSAQERQLDRKGSKQIFGISDCRISELEATFLFYRSDKDLADPIFRNHQSRTRREINKDDDEGHDFSAHVVIRFADDPIVPAKLYLENSQGLGASRIAVILRQLLRRTRKTNVHLFHQNALNNALDTQGAPIKHRVDHDFEIRGVVSADFAEDLNRGVLTDIELISDQRTMEEFDTERYFVETKSAIHLKVNPEYDKLVDRLQQLTRILRLKKDDFSNAKIRFKSASGAEQNVKWDALSGFEERYVRKELLKRFAVPLKSSYDLFHRELLERIRGLADND